MHLHKSRSRGSSFLICKMLITKPAPGLVRTSRSPGEGLAHRRPTVRAPQAPGSVSFLKGQLDRTWKKRRAVKGSAGSRERAKQTGREGPDGWNRLWRSLVLLEAELTWGCREQQAPFPSSMPRAQGAPLLGSYKPTSSRPRMALRSLLFPEHTSPPCLSLEPAMFLPQRSPTRVTSFLTSLGLCSKATTESSFRTLLFQLSQLTLLIHFSPLHLSILCV